MTNALPPVLFSLLDFLQLAASSSFGHTSSFLSNIRFEIQTATTTAVTS